MSDRRATGAAHEEAAAQYLVDAGLSVVERNFSCRYGELDLILRDRDTVVFTEVRYRSNRDFGGAMASVDARKQRKLTAAARWYLQQHPRLAREPCRFDVVAVSGVGPYTVDWLRDAFQPES
jgi:putative endonuclease